MFLLVEERLGISQESIKHLTLSSSEGVESRLGGGIFWCLCASQLLTHAPSQ